VRQVVDLHAAHIALTQSRYGQGLLVMVTFVASAVTDADAKKANHNKSLDHKAATNETNN
jgi:two-component system sensor histidine kinase QseC